MIPLYQSSTPEGPADQSLQYIKRHAVPQHLPQHAVGHAFRGEVGVGHAKEHRHIRCRLLCENVFINITLMFDVVFALWRARWPEPAQLADGSPPAMLREPMPQRP